VRQVNGKDKSAGDDERLKRKAQKRKEKRKRKQASLTGAQIEARKAKFARKKLRRAEKQEALISDKIG